MACRWGAALALWMACSTPRYEEQLDAAAQEGGPCDGNMCKANREDRSVPDVPVAEMVHDATMNPPAVEAAVPMPMPLPGDELLGDYALRVRFHQRAEFLGVVSTPTSSELIMVARIVRNDGMLQMTTRLCRDRGFANSPIGRVNAQSIHPELLEPRVMQITLENGRFRADGPPSLLGYSEPPPGDCSAGAKVPKLPEQVWISGPNCDCPLTDLPPTVPNDCRVRDPDLDMKPGVTMVMTGATETNDYYRSRDTSRFTDGVIAANGLHAARYDKIEDFYQLACRDGDCLRGDGTSCNPAFNDVRFYPLPEDEWTCDALLRSLDQGRYIQEEPLVFPDGC